MNARALAVDAIQDFEGAVFDAHHPQHMWCGCIDGREKAGGNFKFRADTIRVTEIAASFPPYKIAPASLRAKFSFRKLKGVSVIKIVGHSDCGGAQTAIAYPDVNSAPDEDIANIVQTLADTGADIPRLKEAFMMVCEGDPHHAANLLSRHIVLQSLDNISRYPSINEQVVGDKLDVIPLYHVMKRGTGKNSHLERFDVEKQMWIATSQSAITNMCERPHQCAGCDSCHATIDKSLGWDFVNASTPDGGITRIQVPYHIAQLLKERREHFQPRLHAMESSRRTIRVFAA